MSDKFKWTDEAIQMLKDRYKLDGPSKLATELGTSLASVIAKARRLGLANKVSKAFEWTDDALTKLRDLYPTADPETLVREIGMPIYVIRRRASRLGLRSLTSKERGAKHKAERNVSCDIHYFDEWNPRMAYILGFLFADGNVTSRLCDVVVGISATDIAVLNFIKEETKSTRPFYYMESRVDTRGYAHRESVYLTLASTIMVRRLMDLGLQPRKSYMDYPFPEVPDEMMPHFIRGYFDGDGSAYITKKEGSCRVRFVGSPRFITGIRDALAMQACMSQAVVHIERPNKTEHGRVTWGAVGDLRKFYTYIYPPTTPFCLERKRKILTDWLNRPYHDEAYRPWTDEELQTIRDFYRTLGPAQLGERLGRSQRSVHAKAKDLGLL